METAVLVALGFVSSAITTSTGIGWGLMTMPILIALLRVQAPVAVAATLLAGTVLSIVGGAAHLRLGHGNLRLILLLSIGAALGAVAGSYATALVPARIMEKAVAVFVIALGVKTLLS